MSDESGSGSRSDADRAASIAGGVEDASKALGTSIGGLVGSAAGGEAQQDVQRGFTAAGEAAGAAAQAARAVQQASRGADAARRGDGAGTAAGTLGGAAGVAGVAGGALGALGSATGDARLQDASRVARTVQAAASLASTLAREIGAAIGTQRHVRYQLTIESCEDALEVRSFALTEALSRPYEMILQVRCDNRDLDVTTIVGRNASVLLDRGGEHNRRVCGIVDRVAERGGREHHTELELRVVPALTLLGHGRDSRIFQDKNAIQVVEEVLGLAFGPYRRELDASGLLSFYVPREMCVQYRESHFEFVSRLLEEEGVGYYFDFDGEGHERMVLFDGNRQLDALTTMDGNAVPYAEGAQVIDGREPVVRFEVAHRLGATAITVRDVDWTADEYRIEASRDGEDERGFTRSVYDHGHARSVTMYEFSPGARYGASDVDYQAQLRSELLVRDRQRFVGTSMLIGVRPGIKFELAGHPVPGMDGHYVVVEVRHASDGTLAPGGRGPEAHGEEHYNRFECIPLDSTYVPDRRTPKPSIAGVQTAIVSGPNPGEPYTDEYGRVKVRFHWDREAVDPARASAWIRLGQTWAGHDSSGLHAFLFIPRVDSEVIVTFLDGDPDRPLVTGAVYNARNLPPLSLPSEATRSVIRTETVGGGGGHNELSFEDAAGQEEVYLRAERNLRELVQHDHLTHVQNNHRNQVDGTDREIVGGNQFLTVRGDREKTIENSEVNVIHVDRETTVGGEDDLRVRGNATTNVRQNVTVDVGGSRTGHVVGAQSWTIDSGSTLTVTGGVEQTIRDGGWRLTTTGGVTHSITGGMVVDATSGITMSAAGNVAINGGQGVEVSGLSIELRSSTSIDQIAPAGINNLTPTAHSTVAQTLTEMLTDATSAGFMKFSAYMFAVSFTGFNVSQHIVKLDDSGLALRKDMTSVEQRTIGINGTSTVTIRRAAITFEG
ncbi:MAG: type VI secretion system tip protein VgrG [Sandaracinaceae bacterium]|nr:type VI secretion system tip protein VgrG [Sandaracinaceae bacterium]